MDSTHHQLLSLDEVASRLALSRKTVERLGKKGSLTVVQIGRRRFVRDTDLRTFLEALSPAP